MFVSQYWSRIPKLVFGEFSWMRTKRRKAAKKKLKRELEFFARNFSWSRSIENVLCVRFFLRTLQSLMLWFESERNLLSLIIFLDLFSAGMFGMCGFAWESSKDIDDTLINHQATLPRSTQSWRNQIITFDFKPYQLVISKLS